LVLDLYEQSQLAYLREKIREARGEQRFFALVLTDGLALSAFFFISVKLFLPYFILWWICIGTPFAVVGLVGLATTSQSVIL